MAHDRLLLTFTGRDAPGISARIASIVDREGARMHDVEQVVVQGYLTLAFSLSFGDLDIRSLVVVAVAVVIAFQLLLYYVPYGRRLFAIGSNPDAARVAGLPVRRDVFFAFVLSGALAGVAGFLFLVRFGNITVVAGQGLELQVVAAVVVGGVNIFGGSGSMVEAFLGAALINLLQQSLLRWPAASAFAQDAILGLLILLAVASDKVILERLRTTWVRARRRDEERAMASAAEQATPGA